MVAPGKTGGRTHGQFRRLRNIRFKDYVHGRSLGAPKNNGKPEADPWFPRRQEPEAHGKSSEQDGCSADDQTPGCSGRSPLFDQLPYISGNRNHCLSRRRRNNRERPSHRRARITADDKTLRSHRRRDHPRRSRADCDLTRSPMELPRKPRPLRVTDAPLPVSRRLSLLV